MRSDMSQVLIESMLRTTLKNPELSPRRSFRNLVDLALNFSEGHTQQQFLQTVQNMLKNRTSAYYPLLQNLLSFVDFERIITFGMNLGYNSCMTGAQQIRTLQANHGFYIPWSLSLELDSSVFPNARETYAHIIEQGRELGIFTWILYAHGSLLYALNLAADAPDCAFLLFCSPLDLTPEMFFHAQSIQNIMFVLRYESNTEPVCQQLREHGFLYSISICYHESQLPSISNGNMFCRMEPLQPVFTILSAHPSCSAEIQIETYQHILRIRNSQRYQTIPFDILQDNRAVNYLISDNTSLCGFDRVGTFYTIREKLHKEPFSLFQSPLRNIFQHTFPKNSLLI